MEDGEVCVAHFDSDDALRRQAVVSCHADGSTRIVTTDLGQGARGLARGGTGMWVAAWEDTPALGRDGLLVHVVGTEIRERIELTERWPQFLVELEDGDLLVSTWRTDANGVVGGEILRVRPGGEVETFSSALEQPGGLAVGPAGVWAADHATGELVLFPPGGEPLTVRRDLEGPLGLTTVDDSTLCIAGSGADPVQCVPFAEISGDEE